MLQDALLDNNYFHVNIRPFDGLNVAQPFETHPGIWDNAEMLCSRPILTIPAGPGWLDPTNAINGRRTYACIRGRNNSGLSGRGIAVNGSYSQNFSPPIASNYLPSLFDNADYGIDIQAIDLDVRDARFQNIYCNSGFSNPCPIPYPGFSEWPTAIRSNANGARNIIFKNTFFACTNGVNAIRATRNTIHNNQFPNTPGSANLANIHWNIMVFDGPDASTGLIEKNSIYFGRAGVQVQGNRTSTILIRGNKIQNTRLGVVSWRNPRSNISTVSNAINATPLTPTVINLPWNGIHYDELGFNSAVIRSNTIGARTTGIFMTGISGPTGSQNFQVRKNTISMTTHPFVLNNNFVWGENYGIRAISLDQPIISWNQIDGPHLYSSNTVSNSLLGIEVDNNTNPRIYCNTIQEAKDGIVITGANTPGEVRRNVLNPGRTAIWGRAGGTMGAQMSWPQSGGMWHSSDNEFNCPFTLSVLRAEAAPIFGMARWVFNPITSQNFDPGNSNCISTNTAIYSSIPAGIACAVNWTPCAMPIPTNSPIAYITDFSPDFCNFPSTPAKTSEEDDDDGTLEDFPIYTVSDTWVRQMHEILDTLMDSLDSPIQKYYLELNLYRYLERQDSLLQVDTLLENWFSNPERETLVKLREIEIYLADGAYDSALLALNIWSPETDYELAYKTVYSVTARLGTDSVNVLTASEDEQLREIALYCPDSIGSPVHLARSILLVLDTFSGLSDCEYASLQFAEPDSLNPDSSSLPDGEILKVYPNPGDQLVTLEHLLPQGEGYAFRVVNALGQEELWIQLVEGDDLYEWNTSALQQGLYYVFLYQNGFLKDYKLLSILH
jgi:hypothetical protein